MPSPVVIDLSHHNVIPQNLTGAKAAGIVGVIHKATQGIEYVDPKVQARYALARNAGMLWGVYHFLTSAPVGKQVDHFLRTIDDRNVYDPGALVACDHEEKATLDQCIEFMERVEAALGVSPVLYSGHTIKEQLAGHPNPKINKYRLWLAQYSSGYTLPPGWETYWLWQYSQSGNIPGIDPPVDVNQYWGPVSGLPFDWSGKPAERPPSPPTEAMPPDKEVVINIKVPFGVHVTVVQDVEE